MNLRTGHEYEVEESSGTKVSEALGLRLRRKGNW